MSVWRRWGWGPVALVAACSFRPPALLPPQEEIRAALDAGLTLTTEDSAVSPDVPETPGQDASIQSDAAPMDALSPDATAEDGGFAPDRSLADAAVTAADAGEGDAGRTDGGAQPATPCDAVYGVVTGFENLRAVIPQGSGSIRPEWLDPSGRLFYVAVEVPQTLAPASMAFDVWVLSRPVSTGAFAEARPSNIDTLGSGRNSSSDVDLTYVLGENRFWFSVGTLGSFHVESAAPVAAADPTRFYDFFDESARFEASRNYRGPALAADGLLAVVSRGDALSGRWSLVEHRRSGLTASWSPVIPMAGVNDGLSNALDAWIDDAGLLLLFASDRRGSYDLFCTWRSSRNQPWNPPVEYGGPGLLSADNERSPILNGRQLLFSRDSVPGREDVFVAEH